ncbi:MAG TPA: hypothetical protein VGU03_10795 [Frateuria sp.]|uniref:hypothetical protein n=1 Tax=Frateuria sp. TaxID=2211372 RepID=UPI002DE6DEFC|nr:hypothetical protein [Frateuria sp.]
MTSPIQKGGIPLNQIFALYASGAKASATGIYENGNDLANIYAPYVSGGVQAAATGIYKNGTDLNAIFAGISNVLGFNGKRYARNRGRGTATLTLTLVNDGTWNVKDDTGAVLDSGSYLISGGTASNYTVQYVMTGFANGPDPDGGSDTYGNDAPSVVALTTSRSAACSASATVVNTNAANGGTIAVKLYFNGSLVGTSTCTFSTSAAG